MVKYCWRWMSEDNRKIVGILPLSLGTAKNHRNYLPNTCSSEAHREHGENNHDHCNGRYVIQLSGYIPNTITFFGRTVARRITLYVDTTTWTGAITSPHLAVDVTGVVSSVMGLGPENPEACEPWGSNDLDVVVFVRSCLVATSVSYFGTGFETFEGPDDVVVVWHGVRGVGAIENMSIWKYWMTKNANYSKYWGQDDFAEISTPPFYMTLGASEKRRMGRNLSMINSFPFFSF